MQNKLANGSKLPEISRKKTNLILCEKIEPFFSGFSLGPALTRKIILFVIEYAAP